jgi:hypothetical protein
MLASFSIRNSVFGICSVRPALIQTDRKMPDRWLKLNEIAIPQMRTLLSAGNLKRLG